MQLITNCSLWFATFVFVNNDAFKKRRGKLREKAGGRKVNYFVTLAMYRVRYLIPASMHFN